MRKCKMFAALAMAACLMTGSLSVSAADERLGTVVDGSLLTDASSAEAEANSYARGKFLSHGTGTISIMGSRSVGVSGRTNAYQVVDKLNVSLILQRLKGDNWVPVYTYGPKSAYNTYSVTASKTYSVTGGYYYRLVGTHSVVENGTSESVASCTDGIWVE